MDPDQLAQKARSLVQRALSCYDEKYGFGAMSCAAYDTAWVALVTKHIGSERQYLFPQCFQYLLDTQSQDGSWTDSSGAQIDGILNTAAPLLALKRVSTEPHGIQVDDRGRDLSCRIRGACDSLRKQLEAWDISTTDHVGFEIIVPAMLSMLEKEDASFSFEFEAKDSLAKIHNVKMAKFKPEYLYGPQPLTALHSLESFQGMIDYNRVAHHKINGSMLGSPSSTAAYLMNISEWDDEAEAYLEHVLKFAAGRGGGGMPSAFPSTNFESTWMLSTLLKSGFTRSELDSPELDIVINHLLRSFDQEKGVLGFAPSFQPDVDDTAKAITSLNMLGRPASPKRMIDVFETETHLRTYAGERDPSFTANANALLALLGQSDAGSYSSQILKITTFLCNYWWNSDDEIKDKWNTSYLYPSVLLAEGLTHLLALIEDGTLSKLCDEILQCKMAIVLFQVCFRPLLQQELDGSWNHSVEETAYALLILTQARKVSFFDLLREPLEDSIRRGVAFINSHTENPPSRIWVEKVSYSSSILTDSYVLAALKAASSESSNNIGWSSWAKSNPAKLEKHVALFHRAPLFSSCPLWELRGSMVEALLFKPLLIAKRLNVFPRQGLEGDEKYFNVLPLFWTACNNKCRTFASTNFLYEMSEISMLNFQLDEFFEASAGPLFQGRMNDLRRIIHLLLPEDGSVSFDGSLIQSSTTNGHHDYVDADSALVIDRLSRFLRHVTQHPNIQKASDWDRKFLKRELRVYLLAHTQQAEDASRFEGINKSQVSSKSSTSATTFFNWVRTTSSDHISCPYSFSFISCFLGASLTPEKGTGDCFPSVAEKYLANAVCRHLSCMCRMYNDVGSAERDLDEGNLNSVEFPEFDNLDTVENKKMALLGLAQYERSCLMDALGRLDQARLDRNRVSRNPEAIRLGSRRMKIWTMFCDQVDLYGQVYVVQDISARMASGGNEEQTVGSADFGTSQLVAAA